MTDPAAVPLPDGHAGVYRLTVRMPGADPEIRYCLTGYEAGMWRDRTAALGAATRLDRAPADAFTPVSDVELARDGYTLPPGTLQRPPAPPDEPGAPPVAGGPGMAPAHKHLLVSTAIRQRIDDGTYPPGTALPSEEALAAEFGVSRPTIRRGLEELRAADVVLVNNGRGMFVRDPEVTQLRKERDTAWAMASREAKKADALRAAMASRPGGDSEEVTDSELHSEIADAVRRVPVYLGPNAVRLANDGLPVLLNYGEADKVARAALDAVRPHVEAARAEVQKWKDFIERGMTTHMRFGVLLPDGTEQEATECADWCYACRLEKAEAEAAALRGPAPEGN